MSQLEPPDTTIESDDSDATTIDVTVDDVDAAIDVPADASGDEAAALAAAIGAHLRDRQQAAAAASAAASDPVECVDQWRFASRLRSLGKRRIPRDVERGDEWKATARALPR